MAKQSPFGILRADRSACNECTGKDYAGVIVQDGVIVGYIPKGSIDRAYNLLALIEAHESI